jgi:hypothetical protein
MRGEGASDEDEEEKFAQLKKSWQLAVGGWR